MHDKILILDFGSQYTQLIARKIREHNVYCEIYPYNNYPVPDSGVKGIILSGSPFSVKDRNSPKPDLKGLTGKFPVLGICYGAQLLAQQNGGTIHASKTREYGRANLYLTDDRSLLFKHLSNGTQVWMSHGDSITSLPPEFVLIGSTTDVKVGAFEVKGKKIFGIQFHPEVYHTTEGKIVLRNFVIDICGCRADWTPVSFIESTVKELKLKLANDKVVLGISGGVDSTVAAVLLSKAIGKNLNCIFVDNGLLRKNEFQIVLDKYKKMGLNVAGINAAEKFLINLRGIADPEAKRKSIGRDFIHVFEEEAKKIQNVKWLAQGTIYPDVIESVSVNGPSAKIKSHHNVGGLPEKMHLEVVEPLKLLFKDEVRLVGKALNIDSGLIGRHPFPGPGLGIRILGEVTSEKVRLLQEVDYIYIESLKSAGLYDQIWQAAAVLLPVQSVGVMGDERTYENVVALRAVVSTDGMTADWSHLPYEFLSKISNEIINKVRGVNRVVYDISSKPPATIEWE